MRQTSVYYRLPGALLFDPRQGWNLEMGKLFLWNSRPFEQLNIPAFNVFRKAGQFC